MVILLCIYCMISLISLVDITAYNIDITAYNIDITAYNITGPATTFSSNFPLNISKNLQTNQGILIKMAVEIVQSFSLFTCLMVCYYHVINLSSEESYKSVVIVIYTSVWFSGNHMVERDFSVLSNFGISLCLNSVLGAL